MTDRKVRGPGRAWFAGLSALCILGLWGTVPGHRVATTSAARASATGGSDDWAEFGHDPTNTRVSPDTAIGASAVPSFTQVWHQHVDSKNVSVASSPAVAFNTTLGEPIVYSISSGGLVHAFDAVTGATIWEHATGFNQQSSPAVYGNTLYYGDQGGQLVALDATTGALECTYTIPIDPPNTVPGSIQASPVVGQVDGTGPTVFFGDEGIPNQANENHNGGHFWAVTGVGSTLGSCQLRWVFNSWANPGPNTTESGSWDSPALVQSSTGEWLVVFGSSNPDQSLYALDASTGAVRWHFHTLQRGQDEDIGAGPTIAAPGVNGFADGVAYVDGKDHMEYAVDLLTGQEIWSFDLAAAAGVKAQEVSTAALGGDTLYVAYGGYVYALDATTGALQGQVQPGGLILASVTISGGQGDQVLFVGNTKGTEFAYSTATGALLGSVTLPGQTIVASAAVADGMLFFASCVGGTLYAYAPGPG